VVLTTWWLVAPIAVGRGWPRWFAVAQAVPLVVAMEPVRETLGWGQIDLVIGALVLADAVALGRGPGSASGWRPRSS
jgi:alpha-1,2-mannosyltransferase